VRPGDVPRAERALADLGLRRVAAVEGALVSHQCTYVTAGAQRVPLVYDLHWKIANPRVFADLLTYDELMARAVPLPQLGTAALTLAPVDALLLACLHLTAHHHGRERLLWIADVHLLATALSEAERDRFAALAVAKGASAVAAHGLALAREWFGTRAVGGVLQRLARGAQSREPSARFLRPRRRRVHVFLSDLFALNGWQPKLRWMAAHLFPTADYMRRRYAVTAPALLPLLYAHRVLRGVLHMAARLEDSGPAITSRRERRRGALRAYPRTPPVGLRAIWGHLRPVLSRDTST
jgi:hypothetical protein